MPLISFRVRAIFLELGSLGGRDFTGLDRERGSAASEFRDCYCCYFGVADGGGSELFSNIYPSLQLIRESDEVLTMLEQLLLSMLSSLNVDPVVN